jgi:hypothetical protein
VSLSKADEKKVRRWLKGKTDNHVCQTCGGQGWYIGDVVLLMHMRDESIAQPVIQVMCETCANVQLFDALAILQRGA